MFRKFLVLGVHLVTCNLTLIAPFFVGLSERLRSYLPLLDESTTLVPIDC